MRVVVRQAVVLSLIVPLAAACSYFSNTDVSEKGPPVTPATVGKLSSECARLQPLYGPNDMELTREKMDEALKVEMAKWDKDNSGDLSSREIEPLNDELRAENVGASPVTDWNGDGHVDFQEFASGWRTMFTLCDRNASKTVSLRELGYSPNVVPARETPAPTKEKQPEPGQSTRPGGGSGY